MEHTFIFLKEMQRSIYRVFWTGRELGWEEIMMGKINREFNSATF